VLDARGVCVCRDGRSILEQVCLRVDPGRFVCLCGPNGGGKTTFVKAALGLVPTTAGTIELLGEPPTRTCSHVGYVPQRTTIGVGLSAFGLLNPLGAAAIHVSSELAFILNSARLPPARGKVEDVVA
jgi:ABC-type multidrug transport system ATPase subunit